jgi:phosphoribosyl-ATP pyrophosphohydrolase
MAKLKPGAASEGAPHLDSGDGRLERLAQAVAEVRAGVRVSPRTSKLFASGAPKMAQKVIEEAAEAGIEAIRGDRDGLINETVDLFYNLSALWVELDVSPNDIWREMDRREAAYGMAEKLPKAAAEVTQAALEHSGNQVPHAVESANMDRKAFAVIRLRDPTG